MNLLKSTFLGYVSALLAVTTSITSAEDADPLPINLNGQNYKITLIENLEYLVKVSKDGDGAPTNDEITGYMKDMIDAVAQKANFTYSLQMPSGKGASCNPMVAADDTASLYGATYRSQFNCGQEDVFSGDTDMYWSLYYITPFRQLRSRFSMPYKPPADGALTMYGIGEGVKDFEDLIEQQNDDKQGPICLGESTAYANYLKESFPDLKFVDIPNTDAGALQAMKDGTCTITVNAYPYALDFIANRKAEDMCEYNGKPFGIVGTPLGFGLSQFGVGANKDLPVEVTDAITYWLNILMTCAPGNDADECVLESGTSLYEDYKTYGRSDPNLCRPFDLGAFTDLIDQADPSGSTLEGLEDLLGDSDVSDLLEGLLGDGDAADPAPVPAPVTPEESGGGDGRMLGAAAAGVMGAILGKLI